MYYWQSVDFGQDKRDYSTEKVWERDKEQGWNQNLFTGEALKLFYYIIKQGQIYIE